MYCARGVTGRPARAPARMEELVWAIVVSASVGVVVVSDALNVLKTKSMLLKHAARPLVKYTGPSGL